MTMVLGQSPLRKSPPYDAWPKTFIHAIEAALREGMQRIKNNKSPAVLQAADEHDITVWLQETLIDIADDGTVHGYTHDVFQYPHLDSTTTNSSRSSNRVRPDLRFYRQHQFAGAVIDPLQDAWFCECKIIEENHSTRTYKNYWDKGIQRFVHGSYAGAMPHAQMIAYVRWPNESTGLGPAYTRLWLCSVDDEGVCVTKHPRKSSTGQNSADIELRHLWFKFQ
jgi:hypothetical protein